MSQEGSIIADDSRPYRYYCWHCEFSVVSTAHIIFPPGDSRYEFRPWVQKVHLLQTFREKHAERECDLNERAIDVLDVLDFEVDGGVKYEVDGHLWPALHYGEIRTYGTDQFVPDPYKEARPEDDE